MLVEQDGKIENAPAARLVDGNHAGIDAHAFARIEAESVPDRIVPAQIDHIGPEQKTGSADRVPVEKTPQDRQAERYPRRERSPRESGYGRWRKA